MSRFAFVVSACKKYVPELCALLNSLERIGNKHDVHVIGYELPAEFVAQFADLSYTVHFYNVPEAEARQYGGESEILCRKRYWYAAEWGKHHEAVCVLDADMVFVRPVDQFFEVAAKCGYIVGATLEQKRIYGAIDHHRIRGHQLLPAPEWNPKDIACAPMFFDARKFEGLFKDSWLIFTDGYPETNFKAPDMESYNLLLLIEKRIHEVFLIPNMCFVGTNEKLLKPYTRVTIQSDGLLWTESGEPIYIIHGQFYKARWRKQQLLNRHGCANGYLGFADNSDRMAEGALNCLYEHFKKSLAGPIKIDDTKAYSNTGHPVDPEYGVGGV